MAKTEKYYGTGRRKKSIARVYLVPGKGDVTINKRGMDEYFGLETLKVIVRQPLTLTETADKFDVIINVKGGGYTGQAGAIRHGIARALLQAAADYLFDKIEEAGQADDPADLRGRDGVLHGTALHQRYFSAGQHSEKCRNCHNTEPAYLDHQQYYRLPESRPIATRILHDQSRNANGGGRCEQRLVKRRNNSCSR